MRKKLIITAALVVSLTAIAFTGIRYFSAGEKASAATDKRSDLFAIQELIAVIKPFQEARTLDAVFTTTLMASDHKTEMGSFEGRYIKDSMHLYVKSIESENLLNKDFFVAVDHSEQLMFVERPELGTTDAKNFFNFGFLSDLDSLVNLPDSMVFYEKIDNRTAKLTMEWGTSTYYKTELIYDTETKMLKRIHLYPYQDIFMEDTEGEIGDKSTYTLASAEAAEDVPEYIAIVYEDIKLNEPVDRKWFDTGRYFEVENQKLITTKSYKDYEIDFE